MARTERFTLEQVVDAIEASNGLLALAARKLDTSRVTLYRYVNKYATVRRALQEAREANLDFAEGQLMKAVNAGNITAIMFMLRTLGKDRGYVPRQEQTGAEGGPVILKVVYPEEGGDD